MDLDFFNGFSDGVKATSSNPAVNNFFASLIEIGVIGVILVVLISLIILAVAILIIVASCKINVKAGEKWWKAIVPLYNSWIQIKIAGLAWHWFPIFVGVAAFASSILTSYVWTCALLLISFNVNYNLAKKFGKTNAFAFWCTVLPFIFLPILAFGSAKYNKSAEVDPNGIFSIKK